MKIDASDITPATLAPDRFAGFAAGLDSDDWLGTRRMEAWRRFLALPFPTRRSEEWRYTDLERIGIDGYRPAEYAPVLDDEELPADLLQLIEASSGRAGRIVERDGRVVHASLEPSLAERGVTLAPLSRVAVERPDLIEQYFLAGEVAAAEEKLWNLHIAFLTGGYMLHVPAGVEIEAPIQTFRSIVEEGELVSTHTLIVAETAASVVCIDEHLSPDLGEGALALSGVEVVAGPGARVDYISLQRFGRGVKHFAMQHIAAERDARVSGFNVALGGDVSRTDVSSRLLGPGSDSEMLALWFGDSDQHVDFQTLQHHAAPHAHSDLLYKGALTDNANSVFRGLIRVDPHAQLTDAYQTNRNLLLSKNARATSLPNLEIQADDVRCSHGATIGQVDESMLFYLRSRGLTRVQAERLLVFGFFDEVLSRLPVEGVRARVRDAIGRKIGLA